MNRLGLALQLFFRILFHPEIADSARLLLAPPPDSEGETDIEGRAGAGSRAAQKVSRSSGIEKQPVQLPKPSERNDALNLLAALQRDARFIDFIMEPLDAYSDEQVGAAARNVHRDCSEVLQRMFDIQPLREEEEGAMIELPEGFDASQVRLTGNLSGEPPFRGSLCHGGWQARKCELPKWTGAEDSSFVVAPAEIEVP